MSFRRPVLVVASAALLCVHSAGVSAACGWLLLYPPLTESSEWKLLGIGREWSVTVNKVQPYSRWEQHSAYDTAKACESGRYEFMDFIHRVMKMPPVELELNLTEKQRNEAKVRSYALHLAQLDARCISSDVLFSSQPKK